MLKTRIIEYVNNPNSIDSCYNLALTYFNLGQTASAFTFYMKAAEACGDTDNINKSNYLLMCAKCLELQGNREDSVRSLLLHARSVCSENPKIYLELSLHYEKRGDFERMYDEALLGVKLNSNLSRMEEIFIRLRFQMAVAAWWTGKEQLSRDLFVNLKDNSNIIPKDLYWLIQDNLIRLGVNSRSHDALSFNKSNYKFSGIELVDKNYSQALQDVFVLQALNGKRNGTYLEIGSADPFYRNNTWLLESKFDWRGFAVDYVELYANSYNNSRSNICICDDARNIDYSKICNSLADSEGFIDYLQLDCEPAEITLEVLKKIPFDKYKFRTITYEHDHYIDMSGRCRKESREYLESLGYTLHTKDISIDGENSFEDWWVINQN